MGTTAMAVSDSSAITPRHLPAHRFCPPAPPDLPLALAAHLMEAAVEVVAAAAAPPVKCKP